MTALCHTQVVRVVIADDHRLMLDGIRRALEEDGDFEIVGETHRAPRCSRSSRATKPELVLLDVRMPRMDGLACLDEIAPPPGSEGRDALRLVELELVAAALRRGARAYLVKTRRP